MTTSKELILSIIVPVYNAERYLEECLRSLFVQDISADAYEVIAVDNGSRDASAAIIDRLQTEYPNLRKVTLEVNQLPSGARNAGMDAAQGKYLMFVDSDDYLYPNALQSLISVMENDNLDFAHFESDNLLEETIISGDRYEATPIMSGVELYHMNLAHREVSWSKIYRRSFIEQYHMRCAKGLMYEDFEFAHRIYATASRVRHITKAPYVFRKHANSTTKKRVTFGNFAANLIEINVLYDDLFSQNHIVTDEKMVKDAVDIIRYNIWENYRIYPKLTTEEQKEAQKLMRRYITRRFIPYMSRKRFVLLKLGIIK